MICPNARSESLALLINDWKRVGDRSAQDGAEGSHAGVERRGCQTHGGVRVVAGLAQHGVQLPPAQAEVAAAEQWQRQSILQQPPERLLVGVAVDTHDLHQVGDDRDRRLGTEDLGVQREQARHVSDRTASIRVFALASA